MVSGTFTNLYLYKKPHMYTLYRLSPITAESKINVMTVHLLYYALHLILRKWYCYIPLYYIVIYLIKLSQTNCTLQQYQNLNTYIQNMHNYKAVY